MLRAVKLPAGKHTLELRYEPQSLKTTTTLATVATVLIYLLAIGAILLACMKSVKK